MALVRCSCLVSWRPDRGTAAAMHVQVADPECGYVVHRLLADLGRGVSAWSQPN